MRVENTEVTWSRPRAMFVHCQGPTIDLPSRLRALKVAMKWKSLVRGRVCSHR